jgi:hypothetical protein
MDIPMLTEAEWERVSPLLSQAIEQIRQFRREHNCSLEEVNLKDFGREALAEYEKISGFHETNPNALYHHRLSIYGPPCHVCGKPLRTPQAKHCAACGAERKPYLSIVQ